MSGLLTVLVVLVLLVVVGLAMSVRVSSSTSGGCCSGWAGWWGSGSPACG